MLHTSELETLYSLLMDVDKPLEVTSSAFAKAFPKGDIFRACSAIATFLHDRFLKPPQRVVAFFLIFDSYRVDTPDLHPFSPLIYEHMDAGFEVEPVAAFLASLLQNGSQEVCFLNYFHMHIFFNIMKFARKTPRDILVSLSSASRPVLPASPLPSAPTTTTTPRKHRPPLPGPKIGGMREVGVPSYVLDPEMGLPSERSHFSLLLLNSDSPFFPSLLSCSHAAWTGLPRCPKSPCARMTCLSSIFSRHICARHRPSCPRAMTKSALHLPFPLLPTLFP